ncbi:MAG TPA: DNA methyltransferase [Candidatus Saccharimonadales bacterium]|nr:DNA methyltransferase [Candidatus Saccharimonadales bacterium]
MRYLAILGRQPAISLAELESALGAESVEPFGGQALLAKLPNINRLGGTIKLAEVIYETKSSNSDLVAFLATNLKLPASGKVTIGLSFYGQIRTQPTKFGMELKRHLKTSDRSIRLLLPKPRQSDLSAAQLKFNSIGINGIELIIVRAGQKVVLAQTVQYQDIDAYSARDYGRPGRNPKVGMLPPKLAQIMINLSGLKTGTILDPFCGTGVILQEARLMGFKAIGSDINPEMVAAAKANQNWLSQQFKDLPAWEASTGDARTITIKPDSVIVSENYLGPMFDHSPTEDQLRLADTEVSTTTRQFLQRIHAQIPTNIRIVLCLPAWQTSSGQRLPRVVDEIPRLGYTLTKFRHASADQLVYLRPGQHVGRKILVITKSHVKD